jgi:hypothetical protein
MASSESAPAVVGLDDFFEHLQAALDSVSAEAIATDIHNEAIVMAKILLTAKIHRRPPILDDDNTQAALAVIGEYTEHIRAALTVLCNFTVGTTPELDARSLMCRIPDASDQHVPLTYTGFLQIAIDRLVSWVGSRATAVIGAVDDSALWLSQREVEAIRTAYTDLSSDVKRDVWNAIINRTFRTSVRRLLPSSTMRSNLLSSLVPLANPNSLTTEEVLGENRRREELVFGVLRDREIADVIKKCKATRKKYNVRDNKQDDVALHAVLIERYATQGSELFATATRKRPLSTYTTQMIDTTIAWVVSRLVLSEDTEEEAAAASTQNNTRYLNMCTDNSVRFIRTAAETVSGSGTLNPTDKNILDRIVTDADDITALRVVEHEMEKFRLRAPTSTGDSGPPLVAVGPPWDSADMEPVDDLLAKKRKQLASEKAIVDHTTTLVHGAAKSVEDDIPVSQEEFSAVMQAHSNSLEAAWASGIIVNRLLELHNQNNRFFVSSNRVEEALSELFALSAAYGGRRINGGLFVLPHGDREKVRGITDTLVGRLPPPLPQEEGAAGESSPKARKRKSSVGHEEDRAGKREKQTPASASATIHTDGRAKRAKRRASVVAVEDPDQPTEVPIRNYVDVYRKLRISRDDLKNLALNNTDEDAVNALDEQVEDITKEMGALKFLIGEAQNENVMVSTKVMRESVAAMAKGEMLSYEAAQAVFGVSTGKRKSDSSDVPAAKRSPKDADEFTD